MRTDHEPFLLGVGIGGTTLHEDFVVGRGRRIAREIGAEITDPDLDRAAVREGIGQFVDRSPAEHCVHAVSTCIGSGFCREPNSFLPRPVAAG